MKQPTLVIRANQELDTQGINQTFWNLFPNENLMRNYRLIGTQWFGDLPSSGLPNPHLLANTMLETYIQGSSSCMSCHHYATLAGAPNVSADFSFLLGDAQELPQP